LISILDGLSIFPRSRFLFFPIVFPYLCLYWILYSSFWGLDSRYLFIWGFILDIMIGFPRPYWNLFLIIAHYFLFFSHMVTMYWIICQFSRDFISPYYLLFSRIYICIGWWSIYSTFYFPIIFIISPDMNTCIGYYIYFRKDSLISHFF
jgi:uncharacterized protein YhhL (DUF1145 family)